MTLRRQILAIALAVATVVVAACQRTPADASAVPYKVIDEAPDAGNCVVCLVQAPELACRKGDPLVAQIRWNVPDGIRRGEAIAVQILRPDGSRETVARGGFRGHVIVSGKVAPGDRIRLLNESSTVVLLHTVIQSVPRCEAGEPVKG